MIPNKNIIAQNYPNPFNPSTTIEFSIPDFTLIQLTIFNPLGEAVKTLVNENLAGFSSPGCNSILE